MGFYDDMAGVASSVLAEFGAKNQEGASSIQLIRTMPPPGGPSLWSPGTYDLDGVVSAAGDKANAQFIDGTTILSTDLVATCAVPEIEPALTDTVVVDGVARAIKKVVKVPAAGTPVAIKLFIAG